MDRDLKHKYELVRAFPRELENDVRHVLDVMYQELIDNYSGVEEFRLSGETLYIPYRIYNDEPNRSQISTLTAAQQTILFTIYTRHYNGYVRESNVKKAITKATDCSWITPYIVLLIGEYVEEILEVIYGNRSLLNENFIKTVIAENPIIYRTIQSRVVSYWNCYYRCKYPKRDQYVGFKLLDYLNRSLG